LFAFDAALRFGPSCDGGDGVVDAGDGVSEIVGVVVHRLDFDVSGSRETLVVPVRSGVVRAARSASSIALARASSIWLEPSILNFLGVVSDELIRFLRS
jgi:hypothetical protein